MEQTERAERIAVRRFAGYDLLATLGNLAPFALTAVVLGGWLHHAWACAITGGVLTLVGIVLTVVFHAKCAEHPLPWLLSILFFGAAKGCCTAAILIGVELLASDPAAVLWDVLPAVGNALLLCALTALPRVLFPRARGARVVTVLLPCLTVIGATVLLILYRTAFLAFLVVVLLSALLCSTVLWQTDADGAETRTLLSVVSSLYATLLFLVALAVLSEGDACDSCCDGADCDCPVSRDSAKKKKR